MGFRVCLDALIHTHCKVYVPIQGVFCFFEFFFIEIRIQLLDGDFMVFVGFSLCHSR